MGIKGAWKLFRDRKVLRYNSTVTEMIKTIPEGSRAYVDVFSSFYMKILSALLLYEATGDTRKIKALARWLQTIFGDKPQKVVFVLDGATSQL